MINPNTAFEDELYFEYLKNPESVSPQWREYFGKTKQEITSRVIESAKFKPEASEIKLNEGDILEPMGSVSQKIALNMEESLTVPTATSIRTMPVKALDENRRIVNKYLSKMKRNKVSFTHILAWAIVKALVKYPHMNDTFTVVDGVPHRVKRKSINLGMAVDITKKDGTRLLLVPNIKNCQAMNFSEFIEAYDKVVYKTRNNKIELDDLAGTTISLTNPGMIGTTASSPRLMKGQGLIIATGSIDYPTEFQAVRPEILTTLAISKIVTMTNTYDHRIIQGAESAEFLNYLSKLLIGEFKFYDQIFASLKIPFEPIRWTTDNTIITRFGQVDEKEAIEKSAHVMLMINAYRVRGHLLASINPLGFESYYYPELDPAYYGFTIWDLDRVFHADDSWKSNEMPLREIIELLRDTYCGPIGIEFMHIQDPVRKDWIKKTLESGAFAQEYSLAEKKEIFRKLMQSQEFEDFLHTKFVGHKRFSLEGSESVIVLLDKLINQSADSGLDSVYLGMAHRGRLNVLVNIMGKNAERIFDEFDGNIDLTSYHGSGDVKYHLGSKGLFKSRLGNEIKIVLSPNPSHLELVDPVVEGMARARANKINDDTYSKVLPVLIHGDSAFAGQGIVAETLNLSKLKGYHTGGTIHIIINNQIGFTTSTAEARSTVYATDIAKMIQVPIIHVNGHEPEAVISAVLFAFEYRQKFNDDVIIDLLSYRKYGHNESDEPSYTQPLLYKKIKSMQPVGVKYENELTKQGVFTNGESTSCIRDIQQDYYDRFINRAKKQESRKIEIADEPDIFYNYKTAVTPEVLNKIAEGITRLPVNGYTPNPKVKQLLKKRHEMVFGPKPLVDWAMAEALAFGALLLEGTEVRFAGEDTRRGTFSQRHAVVYDINTEEEFTPLNNIDKKQAYLRIWDSPLSELAVLGFEYGYSVEAADGLTLWEAQFGDFANMAQPIFDQFLACGETKWGQVSNLTVLLPHSYDGQGPEHSSARIERYLQLCADNNMLVCNISSPANYFHALRRQAFMKAKKPLIIFTPKSMLRMPGAVSPVSGFTESGFKEIIDFDLVEDATAIKRVLFCTGKIYYELATELSKSGRKDTAIIRVEQLYPFHSSLMKSILGRYGNAAEYFWVQEEPQNMGAWNFLYPRIAPLLAGKPLDYIGRFESSATSTGSFKVHTEEQEIGRAHV